jgi:putative oxidoreductase
MTFLDIGLLILRVVVGLVFAGHGSQKLLGWFDGPGMEGTTAMMENLDMHPPRLWAWLNALGEFLGGLGLALGLLTPLAAAALVGTMLVAVVKVHWPNFWNSDQGIEFPLVMGTVSFVIGLMGAGIYSLDYLLGLPLQAPLAYAMALLLMLVTVGWALTQGGPEDVGERQPA